MTTTVGMQETPCFWQSDCVSGFSTSTLQRSAAAVAARASYLGPNVLHGGHHDAVKRITTCARAASRRRAGRARAASRRRAGRARSRRGAGSARRARARASRRRSARVLAGFDGGLVIGDGLDLRRHVGRRFLRSDSHLSVARSGAHGARVRAPVRVIRTEQVAGKSSAVAQLVAVSTSNSDFYNSARAPAHVAASAAGARSRSARSQDRTAASCSKRRTTFSLTRRRRSRRASASVAKRTARRT